MPKHFIRCQEDFVCEVCGKQIQGNGYTNHCPNCLYSKHVDAQLPGDRQASCLGLMKPTRIESKKGRFYLAHRCLKCGKETLNKTSPEDNIGLMLKT